MAQTQTDWFRIVGIVCAFHAALADQPHQISAQQGVLFTQTAAKPQLISHIQISAIGRVTKVADPLHSLFSLGFSHFYEQYNQQKDEQNQCENDSGKQQEIPCRKGFVIPFRILIGSIVAARKGALLHRFKAVLHDAHG